MTDFNPVDGWIKGPEFRATALMIYGLALECAFKGRILEIDPENIQFDLIADGHGEIQGVSIREFGATDHNLERLGERAGIIKKDADADYREILRRLSDCVTWTARYPVPKKIKPGETVKDSVPIWYRNVDVRTYIDKLFDGVLPNELENDE